MLRIAFCVCIALIFTGCQKNWRGFVVEKRVYRDGYYIHIPWKRYTPKQAYPKPEPYPVDHSRTTRTDSTKKNAGGVANSSQQSQSGSSQTVSGGGSQSGGTGGGVSSGGGNTSNQPSNGTTGGNGGSGNPSNTPAVGPNGLNGTNGTTAYPQTATPTPAPKLQPLPESPTPPLVRPTSVSVNPPADTSVAAKDPPPIDSDNGNGINFPEGEFSLVTELGFYNPVYTSGVEVKPLSYNGGAALRYTIHPWSRHKLSGEFGLFMSQHFIAQDQHKFYPLFTEACDKERIMQWKSRFMLMDHIYVSRKEDAKFDAVEIGLFSDVGFFSSHVAVTTHGNDENAILTRNKSRLFGLHYLRRMQYGLTARVANNVWSVFANYRLNSLVKAGPNGGDLPTLVVGATFSIGE